MLATGPGTCFVITLPSEVVTIRVLPDITGADGTPPPRLIYGSVDEVAVGPEPVMGSEIVPLLSIALPPLV